MRFLLFIIALVFFSPIARSQDQGEFAAKPSKHQFYVYWGWNRGWFSRSDIHFHGSNYDFRLAKVVAHDTQDPVAVDPYLNPGSITVPQTNVRIGYFLSDHWSLSLGLDHMKYVMDANQVVRITGTIRNSNTIYDGVYNNDKIRLSEDFLQFEHTNGLNYIHVALRRHDTLINLKRFRLPIAFNVMEGFDAGPLLPKTNTTLLGYQRYDEFHLAGYGLGAMAGLNITFFDHIFVQSEWKGGFCNMPDIRTTEFKSDRADQHFFFSELSFLVGANFRIGNSRSKHKRDIGGT